MGVAGGRRASGPWRRPGDARDASGGPEAAPGPRQRRRLHPRRPRPLLRHLRPRPPIRRAPRRPDRSYPSPLRFLLAPCAWNVARGRTARGCMAQASRGGSSLLSCRRWRAVAAREYAQRTVFWTWRAGPALLVPEWGREPARPAMGPSSGRDPRRVASREDGPTRPGTGQAVSLQN